MRRWVGGRTRIYDRQGSIMGYVRWVSFMDNVESDTKAVATVEL